MKWTVVARPQAKNDVLEAADWYDRQQPGLGDEFIEEVVTVFDDLVLFNTAAVIQPRTSAGAILSGFLIASFTRLLRKRDLSFIAAVIHAARHDRVWRRRF